MNGDPTPLPYITCERCRQPTPPSDLHPCGPGGRWRYCSRCVNEAEGRTGATLSSKTIHSLPEILRMGRQADPDGIDVRISRQAVEEAANRLERAQRIMARAISWLQIKEAAFATTKGPAIIEEMQRFIAGSKQEQSETYECPHCRAVYEIWAGSDGIVPETAPEAYQERLIHQMRDAATQGLTVKANERREYHANGTYWSGVPTIDMPCDFCELTVAEHDPRTHACPPSNGDGV